VYPHASSEPLYAVSGVNGIAFAKPKPEAEAEAEENIAESSTLDTGSTPRRASTTARGSPYGWLPRTVPSIGSSLAATTTAGLHSLPSFATRGAAHSKGGVRSAPPTPDVDGLAARYHSLSLSPEAAGVAARYSVVVAPCLLRRPSPSDNSR
jgi:hypothetical protein